MFDPSLSPHRLSTQFKLRKRAEISAKASFIFETIFMVITIICYVKVIHLIQDTDVENQFIQGNGTDVVLMFPDPALDRRISELREAYLVYGADVIVRSFFWMVNIKIIALTVHRFDSLAARLSRTMTFVRVVSGLFASGMLMRSKVLMDSSSLIVYDASSHFVFHLVYTLVAILLHYDFVYSLEKCWHYNRQEQLEMLALYEEGLDDN
ncbi:hypothetical protein L3Y34_005200 [Caenorhabditis briggsae]|uniref:Uncharacterized protein n=1 Tax=Caenorhabditis briggsae TaxID=6238 RepID=A0AAE9AHA8_CAEBR|nr:hypothetical protein L3Y34_005200 [Caenorhabditis briggsae]